MACKKKHNVMQTVLHVIMLTRDSRADIITVSNESPGEVFLESCVGARAKGK